jgi:hypothetical protein
MNYQEINTRCPSPVETQIKIINVAREAQKDSTINLLDNTITKLKSSEESQLFSAYA